MSQILCTPLREKITRKKNLTFKIDNKSAVLVFVYVYQIKETLFQRKRSTSTLRGNQIIYAIEIKDLTTRSTKILLKKNLIRKSF